MASGIALEYSDDAPIHTLENDRFDRHPLAKRIAQVISKRNESSSLVIGIYGKWGEGKTSVLNLIDSEIKSKDIFTIRYNPWRYTGEEELFATFYYTVATTLQEKLTTHKEEAGAFIDTYLKPFFRIGGLDGAAEGISTILGKADLPKLRERVNELLAQENKRLVVFIDDIDRLDKDELYAIFRLVKLNAEFRNTVYVLSFDYDVVSQAISEQYGSDPQAGRNFLEKIIQVPIYLPKIPQYLLIEYCFDELKKVHSENNIVLSGDEANRFSEAFWNSFETMLTTPRMARLYKNLLQFSVPLLEGEVNIVDLMLIEGIKVFYPKLYTAIYNNSNLFLAPQNFYFGYYNEARQQVNQIIVNNIPDLKESQIDGLKWLLGELFPSIQNALTIKGYWSKKLHPEEQKHRKLVGTREYFQRYFSYGIHKLDFSDAEISSFLKSISVYTVEQSSKEISTILEDNRRADLFITKLHRNFEIIKGDEKGAEILARAIAYNSKKWTRWGTWFSAFDTPRSHAKSLVIESIEVISDENYRQSLFTEIVLEISELPFAEALVTQSRWNILYDNHAFYKDVRQRLASRIEREAKTHNFLKEYDLADAISIFFCWRLENETSFLIYIRNLLKNDSSMGSKLIWGFIYRYDDILPEKISGLNDNVYKALTKLINPQIVLDALQDHCGTEFVSLSFKVLVTRNELTDNVFGHQLAWHIENTILEGEDEKGQNTEDD